ncbi:MAG: MG2 domain-containing protein, partial [Thiovulaceae bacterium]|nr:MG2 domain-containing protein [Sulfurimonadaceae bacterium]
DNGVYRIVLHYKDKKVAKSVYYSDIGITTKVSKDQIFVWTTKLSTGKPLSGATLKAYSNKNELLGVFKSNANGVAIFNKKNIAAAFPKVITAQESNDHNFLTLVSPLNKINVPLKESLKERFKAMIYVQSKLVRPGNDAKILVLLKDKDYIAAKNLPVKITVLAPNRRTFLETSKKTTSHGAIDLNLPIASDAKTGTYKITAMLGKHLIGSSSFSVENFMPQRIKNSIVFDHDKIVSGELLHATFNSKYLFGAPASGLKANAKLTAVSKRYTHEKYKKFNFTNEQLAKKNTINYLQTNKAFQLDKKGNAKIFFPTKIHQNPPSILTAQVALSVFDDGRAVSTYESVMLYPYPTMVGVALRNNRIEKGQELVMRTLRINPVTGEKIQGKVEAILKKSHWSYTYDSRGYYKWHQKMRIIDRKILDAGASYEKDVDESGDYVVELHDRLSGHSSTQNLTVSGWDYNPINPTHDMGKVQVSLANKAYTKGDTLHLDIKSPITKGSMLLTLEDEKVRWQRVIEIEKASASVDIPLKFNFSDGLYLRTSIVRATNTPSTMIPFRAQSSNFIKANKERFHQKVTLQTLSQNSSNNTQLIQVKAKPQTSVIVSVVDEGILQIKRQKVPKPFEFFQYIPKELIALFDLFDQVMHHITKGTMLSFGGDDSYEAKARRKHMAPKTGAKRVKPFVYWSGIVTTNAQGQAKVNLPIPNFNGEAKIVALAFDQQSVGVASQSLIIKDPIIIKPTFPRFISISDELTVPVRIFNTTKKAKTIKLSVKDNSQSRLKLSQNSVTIAANSSQLIDATLSAKAYGKGEVTILGSSDGKSYIASVEIPVYSAAALETKVYKGETKTDKKIIIDDKYFGPASTQLAMSLSNSYLSQLKGSVNNLLNYPYGCAEQTSSRLLALLHIEKFIQGKMDAHTKALLNDRKRFILEGIGRLEAMQKRSGEFGYWSLTSYINPYASIYTSDVILELSENGYKINNAILSRIFQALKNQANGLGSYRYSKTTTFQRIYAAYLLSRAKRLDRSVLNALYDQKLYQLNLVTRYMMAAILQNANQIQARNKVLKEIEAYNFTGLYNESQLGGSF